METIWCIASPYDWLNVVYTAVAIAVVHFLIEVLVYSTYTNIIIGGLSDVKHHYFISPWSGQDNYLACLYHYGPISPWWLQPQEFFFKQVVITSKMCLAILCIYVCVCVCVCMCWLCVLYSFQKVTPPVAIPQGEECDVVDTWVMVIVNKGMALFGSFCCNVKLTSSQYCDVVCSYFNMPVNVMVAAAPLYNHSYAYTGW